MAFEAFSREPFQIVSNDLYLKACRVLSKDEAAVKVCAGDVVPALLRDLCALRKAVSSASPPIEAQTVLDTFVDQVFIVMSQKKLGEGALGTARSVDIAGSSAALDAQPELVKACHKIAQASCRKYHAGAPDGSPFAILHAAFVKTLKAENVKDEKPEGGGEAGVASELRKDARGR